MFMNSSARSVVLSISTLCLVCAVLELALAIQQCNDGFYSKGNDCQPCPEKCVFCSNDSYCYSCKNGYSGVACKDACSNCKPNTSCEKLSGYCTGGCKDGLSGVLCDERCNEKCMSCERKNINLCVNCSKYRYGPSCDLTCSRECVNSTCRDDTGTCSFGCTEGFSGPRCLCPQGCNCGSEGDCMNCSSSLVYTCGNECAETCYRRICFKSTGKCWNGTNDNSFRVLSTRSGNGIYSLFILLLLPLVGIVVWIKCRERINRATGKNIPMWCCLENAEQQQSESEEAERKPMLDVDVTNETSEELILIESSYSPQRLTADNLSEAVLNKLKEDFSSLERSEYTAGPQRSLTDKDMKPIGQQLSIRDTNASDNRSPDARENDKKEEKEQKKIKKKEKQEQKQRGKKMKKANKKEPNDTKNMNMDTGNKQEQQAPNKSEEGVKTECLPEVTRIIERNSNGEITSGSLDGDYIYETLKTSKDYFACKAPGKARSADFWTMVWMNYCRTIIILTDESTNEDDKYWPPENTTEKYGSITVEFVGKRETNIYIVREFLVSEANTGRTVRLFHFNSWIKENTEQNPESLVHFRNMVRANSRPEKPVFILCSDGRGRSGTYIALDILLKNEKISSEAAFRNVFQCVIKLREQRNNMVATPEQYALLYQALTLLCGEDTETRILNEPKTVVNNNKSASENVDRKAQNAIVNKGNTENPKTNTHHMTVQKNAQHSKQLQKNEETRASMSTQETQEQEKKDESATDIKKHQTKNKTSDKHVVSQKPDSKLSVKLKTVKDAMVRQFGKKGECTNKENKEENAEMIKAPEQSLKMIDDAPLDNKLSCKEKLVFDRTRQGNKNLYMPQRSDADEHKEQQGDKKLYMPQKSDADEHKEQQGDKKLYMPQKSDADVLKKQLENVDRECELQRIEESKAKMSRQITREQEKQDEPAKQRKKNKKSDENVVTPESKRPGKFKTMKDVITKPFGKKSEASAEMTEPLKRSPTMDNSRLDEEKLLSDKDHTGHGDHNTEKIKQQKI